MKRIITLCFFALLVVGVHAQQAKMKFMGIGIGTEQMTVVDKKLDKLGFSEKMYDPDYDVFAYRGLHRGMESCVYVNAMDGLAARVVFRVTSPSWEQLQPLAVSIVAGLKKDYPGFKVTETGCKPSDLKYRLEMKDGMDRISFFSIERDTGVFDIALTYE